MHRLQDDLDRRDRGEAVTRIKLPVNCGGIDADAVFEALELARDKAYVLEDPNAKGPRGIVGTVLKVFRTKGGVDAEIEFIDTDAGKLFAKMALFGEELHLAPVGAQSGGKLQVRNLSIHKGELP